MKTAAEMIQEMTERSAQISKEVEESAERISKEVNARSAQISKEIEASAERISKEVDARSAQISKEVEASAERINREVNQTVARIDAKRQAIDDFKRAFGVTVLGGNTTAANTNEAVQSGEPAPTFDPSLARVSDQVVGKGAFGQIAWIETAQEGMPPLVCKQADEAELQLEARNYELAGEHPNITKCYGVQTIGNEKGLVMEGVKGRNVQDTLAVLDSLQKADSEELSKYWMNKQLSQEDFVGITQYMAMEILSGLAHLEEAGVVHCDIRPNNIMIDETTGAVKIVDLGNALPEGTDPKDKRFPHQTGSVSPDAYRDKEITPRHDAFGLGATIYQTMEHKEFRYGTNKTAEEKPTRADAKKFGESDTGQPKRALTPGTDTEYTRFVNTMMNPDPKKRPSAKALLATVRQLEQLMPEDMEAALVSMEREMPGTGIRFLVQRLGDASRPQELLKKVLSADSAVKAKDTAKANDRVNLEHGDKKRAPDEESDRKDTGYGYDEPTPGEESGSKDPGYEYDEPTPESKLKKLKKKNEEAE